MILTPLSPDEQRAWDQLDDFYKNGLGYAIEMSHRPQTLYALVDSPVGLDARPRHPQLPDDRPCLRGKDGRALARRRARQRHALLTHEHNTTQVAKGGFFDVRGLQIPVAVSAFPDEIYQVPQSWAEKAYPKLIHYNRPDKGGHFGSDSHLMVAASNR